MFNKNKKNCKKNMKRIKISYLKAQKAVFCVEKGQNKIYLNFLFFCNLQKKCLILK